jgi:hypothetical protein
VWRPSLPPLCVSYSAATVARNKISPQRNNPLVFRVQDPHRQSSLQRSLFLVENAMPTLFWPAFSFTGD